jgi:PAS domain S-box-containing protein
MTKAKGPGDNANNDDIRKKAEELHDQKKIEKEFVTNDADALKLIHELEVHQIELELQQFELQMQNEELQIAKAALVKSNEKYVELYDFAPTGYFTLSKEGIVKQVNLSGAKMLGRERSRLIESKFGFFVSNETKKIFNESLAKVFISFEEGVCEVVLSFNGIAPVNVLLYGIVDGKEEKCFMTAIDITERKKLVEELIKAK